MSVSHQWTYSFLLDEHNIDAVEAALSHCQAQCQQGLVPDALFWTDSHDVEAIKKKIFGFFIPVKIPEEIWRNPYIHKSGWVHLDVELEENEMMAFDAMLSCYQVHCREQMALGGDWQFRNHDQWIGCIRNQVWASPPTAG